VYSYKTSIKHWAEEDRPREKLLLKGRAYLSNTELLSIIIGSGYKSVSALELAKRILSAHKNDLYELGKLSVIDFQKYKGIGEVKSLTIVAALELGRRRKSSIIKPKTKISSSKDAYDCLYSQMTDLEHEVFFVIMLNRNNRILKKEMISIGGVAGTVVDPKIIFKRALEQNASSLILAHNHPSGNLLPSEADIKITNKLVRAANDLDLKILDHLIIGSNEYYSFADEGKI